MKEHARFSICGRVRDKFVSPKGNFARLSISIDDGNRSRTTQVKAFAIRVVADIGSVANDDFVTVVGEVQSERVVDKQRQEVKVDGRVLWAPSLVASEIKREAIAKKAPPPDDDEVGF